MPLFDRRLSLPGRVLYAVRHSFPFASDGYAVRTHRVAQAMTRSGCEMIVCTAPGLPWAQPQRGKPIWPNQHRIDGVRYVHTPFAAVAGESAEARQQRHVEVYAELIRVFKPAVVMAASNWANALSPAGAAKAASLPFFYEVRGFWEITRVSRDPGWAGSREHEQAKMLEHSVAVRAERLFTLNPFMRDELVARGLAAQRIALVPNGFDGWVARQAPDSLMRKQLGIRAAKVVGYIGSFNAYEGLEDLITAVARIRKQGINVALMLVGSSAGNGSVQDGSELCAAGKAYQSLARRLGMADDLHLPGRIDPGSVASYYSLLDLVVIPRRPVPVCELVSPLKPLEAAAHEKRVLMSDVAPLAELRGRCHNFFYFRKGQPESLSEQIAHILSKYPEPPDRCRDLEQLTWQENVRPMVEAVRACR